MLFNLKMVKNGATKLQLQQLINYYFPICLCWSLLLTFTVLILKIKIWYCHIYEIIICPFLYREEEVEALKKQLSDVSNDLNETREHEVNKLKEELTRKGEELRTAETMTMTMESLKVQVTQLIQENQSLTAEKERIMDDCTQQYVLHVS